MAIIQSTFLTNNQIKLSINCFHAFSTASTRTHMYDPRGPSSGNQEQEPNMLQFNYNRQVVLKSKTTMPKPEPLGQRNRAIGEESRSSTKKAGPLGQKQDHWAKLALITGKHLNANSDELFKFTSAFHVYSIYSLRDSWTT